MHTREEKIEALGRVIDTLERLRVECPWDRKQTNESLRPNTIEEVYELSDALLAGHTPEIRKELGDVLLHVLFYSKIGEEKQEFDIVDVADALNAKLIFRHPHIFGDVKVNDAHDVELNWEKIKLKEKEGNRSVLAGVPKALPSLVKAYRIQEKAANVGFDWEEPARVWDKVKEEIAEFEAELPSLDPARREHEMGDLIFSLVNAARLYKINPDTALEHTNRKFTERFGHVENQVNAHGGNWNDFTVDQLEQWWQQAKHNDR